MKTGNPQVWLPGAVVCDLTVTFDVPAGAFRFEWRRTDDLSAVVASGFLVPAEFPISPFNLLDWTMENPPGSRKDGCSAWPASTRAFLNRIRKKFPLADGGVRLGLLVDQNIGVAQAGRWLSLQLPAEVDSWKWLGREIQQFAGLVESQFSVIAKGEGIGRAVMEGMAAVLLGVAPSPPRVAAGSASLLFDLCVTFHQVMNQERVEFVWTRSGARTIAAIGRIRCPGGDQMNWELEAAGQCESTVTSTKRNSIQAAMHRWLNRYPMNRSTFTAYWVRSQPGSEQPVCDAEPPFAAHESPIEWVEDNLVTMVEAMRFKFSPLGRLTLEMDAAEQADFEGYQQKLARKEQKRMAEEARLRAAMARQADERRRREAAAAPAHKAAAAKKPDDRAAPKPPVPNAKSVAGSSRLDRPPVPPVPVHFKLPPLEFQETTFPLADLRGYALRERAAQWWVSNQSDDLLCLPNCRIEHLEYQLRTALRVLGPLRGRALLSDEVGLGKTIEAGLIIKELLTRGMVKKILILTVPSLVDQWEEELSEKFSLTVVTTNHPLARNDPQTFWRESPAIIASLHTAKQPAQLEIARQVPWDILVVDEAHYLRNRESQAWQAVNALPRHFLLLLTATPVQNSLEELYNLVTLLQPGQLPTPKEFRTRFFDPKRPRQPREPEELRRLLGQVMIRNTRANAGLKLPPRRAETVLFEPDAAERSFWQQWETELRLALGRLNPGQSSLWGRLLLQTAGSSPAAWRSALEKFPDAVAAKSWRDQAPLESSWRRKCELILPLTRAEGGVVIFTQYLQTQSALAEFLRAAGATTFLIHGGTPAVERQPVIEDFRKSGGALLLTHSGTEGRNLQFSHQLVNFDLPWNPMEIEQRIGRLHRLGQQRPVRIYNFVQAGTLQEHLLDLLQEKLNLFELVVGETGLVLGERFGSDEFAEEIFRRWRESDGRLAEAFAGLGDELAAARDAYGEVKQLDETLFAKDYESL